MAQLRVSLQRVGSRLNAFLKNIGPRNALLSGLMLLIALSLVALTVAVILLTLFLRQQSAEQTERKEQSIPQEPIPQVPLIFGPGPIDLTEATNANGRLLGIPGFQEMDLLASLQYLPNTNFSCPGGSPDQGLTKRVCTSPPGENSTASYEVTVIDKGATTLLVEATAYDASEEEAATFLTSVAKLTLKGVAPINSEAWVTRNISSGGEYAGNGVDVRLYGSREARTLEIVGTERPTGQSAKTTGSATRDQTTPQRAK